MDNYRLHLRITSVGSPASGQPHAGGAGSGDVLVDQVIDLRQWVAERMVQDPVEPAVVAAPKERVWHTDTVPTAKIPANTAYSTTATTSALDAALPSGEEDEEPDVDEEPVASYGSFGSDR
jgi:hypothetical protein